jgi:Fe-S-cluster containining protein
MSNAHSPDKGYDRHSKGVELCLSCGFCCKGILLFNRVTLETDETELVSQLGLTPYQKKGDHDVLGLPCPYFNDGKCSVYAQRPRKCKDYQCKLLKGYLQGTISFGESIEFVRKAISLMEAIYQYMGGVDPSKSIWKQIRNFLELQARSEISEESRRITALLLLDVKKLSIICNHFGDGFFR